MPIKNLGLTPSVTAALEHDTNGTVGHLLFYTKEELATFRLPMSGRRIGPTGAEKVWKKLEEIGAV